MSYFKPIRVRKESINRLPEGLVKIEEIYLGEDGRIYFVEGRREREGREK